MEFCIVSRLMLMTNLPFIFCTMRCVMELEIVAVLMVMMSLRRCCVMAFYMRVFRNFYKSDRSDISANFVHID